MGGCGALSEAPWWAVGFVRCLAPGCSAFPWWPSCSGSSWGWWWVRGSSSRSASGRASSSSASVCGRSAAVCSSSAGRWPSATDGGVMVRAEVVAGRDGRLALDAHADEGSDEVLVPEVQTDRLLPTAVRAGERVHLERHLRRVRPGEPDAFTLRFSCRPPGPQGALRGGGVRNGGDRRGAGRERGSAPAAAAAEPVVPEGSPVDPAVGQRRLRGGPSPPPRSSPGRADEARPAASPGPRAGPPTSPLRRAHRVAGDLDDDLTRLHAGARGRGTGLDRHHQRSRSAHPELALGLRRQVGDLHAESLPARFPGRAARAE